MPGVSDCNGTPRAQALLHSEIEQRGGGTRAYEAKAGRLLGFLSSGMKNRKKRGTQQCAYGHPPASGELSLLLN